MLVFLFLQIASAFPLFGSVLFPPSQDSFYTAPENLEDFSNGQVYDYRGVINSVRFGVDLAKAVQIAYRTTDTQGEPSFSIATVFSPVFPSIEPKVLSYQAYEDSVNIDCSTSYSIAHDGDSFASDASASIAFALYEGWHVIVPDQEGSRSGFIAGHEQGQAGLDAIRAGISYLELDPDTPVALLGYSGGASATVWMANLQEDYAPDLNIVGAAHGGTPVDLLSTINHLDNADNFYSGFIVGAFTGLLNSYPELEGQVWPYLDTELQNAITTSRKSGFCAVEIVLEFMHQEWHTKSSIDLLNFGPFLEVLQNESLLTNVSSSEVSVPSFPRYIWHATQDQIIPYDAVVEYVDQQCQAGANIQFVPWSANNHGTIEIIGLPDALNFVKQALEFDTPQLTCGTANNDIILLGSQCVAEKLGQPIADVMQLISTLTAPLGNLLELITDGYRP